MVQNASSREGAPPKVTQYQLGTGQPVVSEVQGAGSHTNAVVAGAGEYGDIARGIAASGLTNREVAEQLRDIVASGQLITAKSQHGRKHADLINRTALLMFGRESIRNPANVAMAPMTLDLVARGNMSWTEAFAGHEGDAARHGGRGAFPMSMQDAVSATRDNAVADERPVPGSGPRAPVPARAELRARETELVVRWLTLHSQTKNGLLGMSEGTIQKYMEQKVLAFYGLG
jgi:hypothetical protein